MKTKLFEISALFAFFICILLSTVSLDNKSENIRRNVLRLHVIASSDSEDDQRLKIAVRDEILKEGTKFFSQSESKNQAQEKISAALPCLRRTAESFIRARGYDYEVSVRLENCFFPTRTYENYTLPAGNYDAVRVIIGEGKGKNWWCVMFPQLCLPAATGNNTQLEDVLSENEMQIITKEKYELRLWLVEKWQQLKLIYKNKIEK